MFWDQEATGPDLIDISGKGEVRKAMAETRQIEVQRAVPEPAGSGVAAVLASGLICASALALGAYLMGLGLLAILGAYVLGGNLGALLVVLRLALRHAAEDRAAPVPPHAKGGLHPL